MLKELDHRIRDSEITRQRLRYGLRERCRYLLTAPIKTRSSVGDTDEYFIDKPPARTRWAKGAEEARTYRR